MKRSTKRVLVVGGALAAAAAAVGVIMLATNKTAAASPQSLQLPPGANLLTPITDAGTVRYYQNGVADGLSRMAQPDAQLPGLSATSYTVSQVDGNWQNPAWMAVLSIIQQDLNAAAASNNPPGWHNAPAGLPAQLRTDGVLDYVTAIMLANA